MLELFVLTTVVLVFSIVMGVVVSIQLFVDTLVDGGKNNGKEKRIASKFTNWRR